MDRTTLIDFFEEVETTEEYNGYFCSIAEASELWCWAACAGSGTRARSIIGRKMRT